MTIVFSPAPKPIAPPKAPTLTVRKKNTARAASEFRRCYHSRARQKFVNLQPCAACGVWGYSVNAHLLGNDGGSRKGYYTTIGPLCGIRPGENGDAYQGCHNSYDEHQAEFRARFPQFNARRAAAETQRAWLTFCEAAS